MDGELRVGAGPRAYALGWVRPTERIERDGLTDFQRAAPRTLAAAWRIDVLEFAGAVCTVVGSAPQLTLANRVIGLGLGEPATDNVLEAIEAFFGRHRAGFMAVCAAGSESPGFLAGWFGALVGRAGWHCFLARTGEHAVATGVVHRWRGGLGRL